MSEILTFEQAVQAAFEGKDLQFRLRESRPWINSAVNGNKYELVRQVVISSTCDWRIKPDALEEAWFKYSESEELYPLGDTHYETEERGFKAGWKARESIETAKRLKNRGKEYQ